MVEDQEPRNVKNEYNKFVPSSGPLQLVNYSLPSNLSVDSVLSHLNKFPHTQSLLIRVIIFILLLLGLPSLSYIAVVSTILELVRILLVIG
jgi:hypothetical protein